VIGSDIILKSLTLSTVALTALVNLLQRDLPQRVRSFDNNSVLSTASDSNVNTVFGVKLTKNALTSLGLSLAKYPRMLSSTVSGLLLHVTSIPLIIGLVGMPQVVAVGEELAEVVALLLVFDVALFELTDVSLLVVF